MAGHSIVHHLLTEEVFAQFQSALLLKNLHTVSSPARLRGEWEELVRQCFLCRAKFYMFQSEID
jgi:hypothetical protein